MGSCAVVFLCSSGAGRRERRERSDRSDRSPAPLLRRVRDTGVWHTVVRQNTPGATAPHVPRPILHPHAPEQRPSISSFADGSICPATRHQTGRSEVFLHSQNRAQMVAPLASSRLCRLTGTQSRSPPAPAAHHPGATPPRPSTQTPAPLLGRRSPEARFSTRPQRQSPAPHLASGRLVATQTPQASRQTRSARHQGPVALI